MKLENILTEDFLLNNKIKDFAYTESCKPVSFDNYKEWVGKGHAGVLNYLTDFRLDKRKNIKNYFKEYKSALVFLFDYSQAKKELVLKDPKHKIASYSIGFDDEDYHFWIKDKLEFIGDSLKSNNPELDYKLSLDIHPVLERDLAYSAGLGWFGKNSMLISKEHGSFTLIGSILFNSKLDYKKNNLEIDHCGHCVKCIEACPTNAIIPDTRTIDANKCVSTYTIELFKDQTPPKGYPNQNNDLFGCDICQDVCPWNNKILLNAKAGSSKILDFFNDSIENIFEKINSLSNKEYKQKFKKTSFERLGKQGLLKNIKKYL